MKRFLSPRPLLEATREVDHIGELLRLHVVLNLVARLIPELFRAPCRGCLGALLAGLGHLVRRPDAAGEFDPFAGTCKELARGQPGEGCLGVACSNNLKEKNVGGSTHHCYNMIQILWLVFFFHGCYFYCLVLVQF